MVYLISTHAPLAGRDGRAMPWRRRLGDFNPRAPCGARPSARHSSGFMIEFQPTRPLRGATAHLVGVCRAVQFISTHAPLAGRDRPRLAAASPRRNFNPRAPCGARPSYCLTCRAEREFQPTRPLRGATCGHRISAGACRISTHAPLAGRDYSVNLIDRFPVISTHAPLAGRDNNWRQNRHTHLYFNPRAPCGARHGQEVNRCLRYEISTHAPLAGRDRLHSRPATHGRYFNPRAPCGARRLGLRHPHLQ